MAARTKARKRALDVLYAAEARRRPPLEALDEELGDAGDHGRTLNDYTSVLVRGVAEHDADIDRVISMYAQDWTLDRMPAVDRNVLRLGVYELLYGDDIPGGVAISEAVALVADLSTDESPTFVNGLLAQVLRDKTDLTT